MARRADPELLSLAAEGDEAAAAEIFDRYSARLMRFLAVILGDLQSAEDVLQSSFAYLFAHAEKYDPRRAALFTWLMRIARSYAKNEMRRRNRKPFLSLESLGAAPSRVAPVRESAVGEDRERIRLALEVLERLPPKEREAITMRYVDGMGPGEIAAVLGVQSKAVSMRIWRALKKIRSLQQVGDNSE